MASRITNDNHPMDKSGETTRPTGRRTVAHTKRPTYKRSLLSRQWRPDPSEETEPLWIVTGIAIVAAVIVSLLKQ